MKHYPLAILVFSLLHHVHLFPMTTTLSSQESTYTKDLEQALALSYSTYIQEQKKTSSTVALPEELYAAYVPLAEQAKEIGLTPEIKKSINSIVHAYLTQGTPSQKELVTTILCEDLVDSPLQRCPCDAAPLNKRIELILDMQQRRVLHSKKDAEVYTSFGSGLLLQDFWAIRELQKETPHVTVNLIDSEFNEARLGSNSQYYDLQIKALTEFSKKTGLRVNRFDETRIAKVGVINVFTNAYDYIRVCLTQPTLKSTVMTMIDPFVLSDADHQEEAHILGFNITKKSCNKCNNSADNLSNESCDDDSCEEDLCDVIVSMMNTGLPKVYIQSSLVDDQQAMTTIGNIQKLVSKASDAGTLKQLIEAQYQHINVELHANPILIYRDMIELALSENGFAYIIADEIEPLTNETVKIIERRHYQQAPYNDAAYRAEQTYFYKDNYIDL